MPSDLSPHQFGDQGTLFDAPLGQPDAGTFKGNPHARLYRAVALPSPSRIGEATRRSEWGDDVSRDRESAFHEILNHVSRPRQDALHNISMGIHWQHDLGRAQDYANDLQQRNRHGEHALTAIIEADHPGLEHVIDTSTKWRPKRESWESPMMPVPPKEIKDPDGRYDRNKLTGHAKDWALVNDTIGPHDMDSAMYPEVPIRPGAPMRVHALHLPDAGSWSRSEHLRNPVQFRGTA